MSKSRAKAKQPSTREEQALALLDRERDILLNGPLTALEALVVKREALLTEILAEVEPAPEGFLAILKTKAERNGRLLLASLAGLRTAREQIEEADQAARTLRTYTAAGTSVAVSEAPKAHDHRR
jgi:hypothetical protein